MRIDELRLRRGELPPPASGTLPRVRAQAEAALFEELGDGCRLARGGEARAA